MTAVGAASSVIGVSEPTLADGVDRVGISRIPAQLPENIATQHVRLPTGLGSIARMIRSSRGPPGTTPAGSARVSVWTNSASA